MIKLIRSTITAIALGLLFSIPYAAPIDAAAKFDDSLNLMTISNLPACTAANSGSSAAVSDYAGSIAWGAAVGTGGGTGIARVYCNGATWTVFAGGGGGNVTSTSQAFVLNAPNQLGAGQTINGNYATGCAGSPGAASGPVDASPAELKTATGQHTCLTFDDHWNGTGTSSPTTGLNLNNWYPGLLMCNANGACGGGPGGASISLQYPLTSWGNGTDQGTQDLAFYLGGASGYVPSTPSVTGLNLTHTPISRVADGSLQLSTKFYYAQNGTGAPSSFCTTRSSTLQNCNAVNWIGAAITSGGIVGTNYGGYPLTINNNNALIPITGGMMQWRMKTDNAISTGSYPGMECDSNGVSSPFNWGGSNANFEFGYLDVANAPTWTNKSVQQPGASFRSIGQGINNTANQNNPAEPGNDYVQTGDDGIGVGDVRNWHTYAVEWTGNSGPNANQWWYYVDGISQSVSTHFESNTSGIDGWYCHFTSGNSADLSGQWSFHSMWLQDGSGNALQPGPYNIWISDIEFYKKPGT